MEKRAKIEYEKLTLEELQELNFTGEWELDQNRFTKEYKKNLEIFNDLNMDCEYGGF